MQRVMFALLLGLLLGACSNNDQHAVGATPGVNVEKGALRDAAEGANFYWGAAVNPALLDDPEYAAALAGEFTVFTAENHLKFPVIHPAPGEYNFVPGDKMADFARTHGMKMRGHVLIWREDLGPWLGDSPTREEAIELMREHIFTVLGHYRDNYADVFVQWDVVNEAFRNDGTMRASGWQQAIGDDFVELAFEFAHQAWPELELYYNDFFELAFNAGGTFIDAGGNFDPDAISPGVGITGPLSQCDQSGKCQGVRALMQDFVAREVPVHGVGFQGHIGVPLAPDYLQFSDWVAELGLRWAVTELDAPCLADQLGPVNGLACYDNQAQVFADVVDACHQSPACNTVVQWGVADPFSWWPGLSQGALANPLALDKNYQYKPAAHAVQRVLQGD